MHRERQRKCHSQLDGVLVGGWTFLPSNSKYPCQPRIRGFPGQWLSSGTSTESPYLFWLTLTCPNDD